MFEGIITALVTPFKNGEVDYPSLKNLLKSQLDQGIDGFVVHGTTAESPTTTDAEKEKIFQFVKSEVAGQVPLIVGTGTNSTQDTIQRSQKAEKWGAKALLVVVPYYNKPPQRGLFEHFNKVANSVEIPTILYNVPGRTITSLELDTILSLSENKKIVGIKEATGDVEFGAKIISKVRRDFNVLSGDDKTCMALAAKGGKGVIAVVSHLISGKMQDTYKRIKAGDAKALIEYEKYFPLIDSMYVEANPIPVKYALKKIGILSSDEMRLPLVSISEEMKPKVDVQVKGFV
ncbi:MAG: 4-hydroxy-tetrahydrodipicolinate synthase [Bdellovibrionota bacterium]